MTLIAPGNSDPGQLDVRVTIQYRTVTRDAIGGEVETWNDVATVWAARTHLGGGRMYAAEAKHYSCSLAYKIRHRVDVAAGMRLIHGDDTFEIVDTPPVGRRHFLELGVRGVDRTPGDAVLSLDVGDGVTPLDVGDGHTPVDVGRAA